HNRAVAARLDRLREQGRSSVQRSLAEAMRPAAGRLADYLLAAREVARPGEGEAPAEPAGSRAQREQSPPEHPPRIASRSAQRLRAVAEERKLDAALLERWVAHLGGAGHDSSDPFHAWARAERADSPGPVLRPILAAWKEQRERARRPVEVLVDYG